jgi:hypothetical protein
MAAAAIPLAKVGISLAGAGLGKLFGRKSKEQKQAMETTAAAGPMLTGAAGPMLQQGSQLGRQGAGYLEGAGQYYRNILGDRTAARSSLAPENATALEYYRGAEGKAKRTLRGGSRDYALAELDRQKVGQLAGFLPMARANAAQQLGGLGGTAISGGTGLSGTAGGLLSEASGIGQQQFEQAGKIREQGKEGGQAAGSLIHDILGGYLGDGKKGSKGGGGRKLLSSSSYAPGLLMGGPGTVSSNL